MSERPAAAGGLRLWPVALILVLAGAALIWIWSGESLHRQSQVIRTLLVAVLTLVALVLWLLLASRLRRRRRMAVAVVVLTATLLALVEVRGVSGDLIPIFAWRWSPRVDESLAVTVEGEVQQDVVRPMDPARDFPQFLGPHRDATLPHARLDRDWARTPPVRLWRQPVGAGWSGFAVLGPLAITHEQRGASEVVVAYDVESGAIRWTHSDEARFADVLSGDGPRATPAIADGRVYSLGAGGLLNCLDLETGARLWWRDILADHGASVPGYGVTASPLVMDDVVVVAAGGREGGSLAAYDRLSGAPRWSGGDQAAAYSSPRVATLVGVRQILLFGQAGLAGHDASSGSVLWHHPWPSGTERTSQPLPVGGDRLFLSSGYGIGGQLLEIGRHADGGFGATVVWESTRLKTKFTNAVQRDGYLYGLDDGVLVALGLRDGERAWKRGRYGHGHVLLAGDLLLVQTEKGEVVLVEATPEAHRELGRFTAVEGKTWNTPALAGDLLLIRNATEATCFRLPTL